MPTSERSGASPARPVASPSRPLHISIEASRLRGRRRRARRHFPTGRSSAVAGWGSPTSGMCASILLSLPCLDPGPGRLFLYGFRPPARGPADRQHRCPGPRDLGGRERAARVRAAAGRCSSFAGSGTAHRYHRAARRRQIHPRRASGHRVPPVGSARGCRGGRSHQPLHGRRAARRPHPNGVRRPGPGGLHPLDGKSRLDRRSRHHHPRGVRPARRGRLRSHPGRDGGRGAVGARRRADGGRDSPRAGPRVG